MDYISHSVGAVISGVAVVYIAVKLNIDVNPLFIVGGSLAGGLLPDIDIPTSYLGSKLKPISTLIYNTVGHRTLTHSLFFMVIVGILISLYNINLGIGMMIGILSHIVLDMVTPRTNGVCLYYPFSKKRIRVFRSKYK